MRFALSLFYGASSIHWKGIFGSAKIRSEKTVREKEKNIKVEE